MFHKGVFISSFQKEKGRLECSVVSFFFFFNASSSKYSLRQSGTLGDGEFCHPSMPSSEIWVPEARAAPPRS